MRIHRNIFPRVTFLMALLSICMCSAYGQDSSSSSASPWNDSIAWYTLEHDSSKVDVFYILSTEIAKARDEQGNVSYRATLSPDEKVFMDDEFNYVRTKMFQQDFNFIAPYYHQLTFETIEQPEVVNDSIYNKVTEEVCSAFDYYMANYNNGRRFILAGFSQGAMMSLEVLRHMTDEQYKRMVAAYILGYRITKEDLECAHIKPAKGETDTGVCISFNSVASREGIWDRVSKGAVTCINPVNWRTDATPVVFSYHDDTGIVRIDKATNNLLVDLNTEKYNQWMKNSPTFSFLNPYNRHHFDILFYTPFIHANAVKRAGQMH